MMDVKEMREKRIVFLNNTVDTLESQLDLLKESLNNLGLRPSESNYEEG